VTTSVTLPSDLPPWLDRLADSEQRSRSFVLTAVMRAVRECVGDDPEPGDLRKVLTAMGAGEAA
jgi:metal-responsive CopG/Arc/MetJ family transcriptional regulator